MIILKPSDINARDDSINGADANMIAKYMINYMHGAEVFDNSGDFVEESKRVKFPIIKTIDGELTFKPAVGMIFISSAFKTSSIMEQLKASITLLESKFNLTTYLYKYHTINKSQYTCIKAKPSTNVDNNAKPKTGKNGKVVQKAATNFSPMSMYVDNNNFTASLDSRFTWIINSQEQFVFDLDNNNRLNTIAHHILSIWYDSGNILSIKHQQFVNELRRLDIVSYANKSEVRLHLVPILNNIAIELSTKLIKGFTNHKNKRDTSADESSLFRTKMLRRFDPSKIFRAAISRDGMQIIVTSNTDDIITIPITPSRGSKTFEMLTNVCNSCHMKLYDDNYAFVSEDVENKTVKCQMYCPMCAHCCSVNLCDLAEYTFVVTSTYTADDAITDATWISTEKKVILRDILRHRIVPHGYTDNKGSLCRCLFVGDKYVIVDNINEFVFQEFSSTCNRKIISLIKNSDMASLT